MTSGSGPDRTAPISYLKTVRLSPQIRRITQDNPGIFTGPGTNTHLIGTAGLFDDASIRGSKKAANTSLESYTQEQNCLHCHTYQPLQMGNCFPSRGDSRGWKNLYVSHLFGLLCPQTGH